MAGYSAVQYHLLRMSDGDVAFPIRTDTYQTQKSCAVVLYTRGHTIENIITHPEKESLTIEVTIDGKNYVKAWAFYASVKPESLKIDQGKVKTEFVLLKETSLNWPRVEAEEGATVALYERWSRVQLPKEEEDKAEGLDHFLQKIYKDASPEAQRAMLKSITESQGTVLSTNWEDVGARHVEPQPPKD
jgi:suppressor of G2 allele of SKP1